jgi:DNA sulfur modification protein DndD
MRIERIKIENFGVLHSIDLDLASSDPNIVFVNGFNGRGKTTFLDAIKWCFYAEEPKPSKFLSNYSLKNTNDQDTIVVRVVVSLIVDSNGAIATVEREQTFQRIQDGVSRRVGASVLTIQTRKTSAGSLTETLSEVDAEKWLNHYFAKKLMNFFLFNGESMAKFFDSKVKDNIEGAVRQIARVDHFEDIANTLDTISQAHNKRIAKLIGANSERIAIDLEDARGVLRKLHESVVSDNDELSGLRAERNKKSAILEGKEGIEASVAELKEVERSISVFQDNLSGAQESFQNEVLSYGVMGVLAPAMDELLVQIENAKKEDRLPPPWDPERIRSLLANETCICGAHVAPHGEAASELTRLIERYQVSSTVGKQLSELGSKANEIKSDLIAGWKIITVHNNAIVENQRQLNVALNRSTELLDSISDVDVTEVGNAASEIKRLDRDIERLVGSIAATEVKGRLVQGQVDKLQKDFDNASEGNKSAEKLRIEAKFAREVAVAARSIHVEAIKRVRERIQDSFNSKFGTVKGGSFQSEISEDFEIIVKNEYGEVTELSEGEKMMQAYAFSMALREVINLSFPLIVDTPFGRLDGKNRQDLAKKIVTFLKAQTSGREFQAMFMMHDLEYTPYTKKYFSELQPFEAFLGSDPGNPTVRSRIGFGIDPDWTQVEAWKDWSEGNIK